MRKFNIDSNYIIFGYLRHFINKVFYSITKSNVLTTFYRERLSLDIPASHQAV